ncbi:MAG TPA: prephenate dehydratase domain-containing protein [Gemmatimonadaceae bacterium]|nr:prephenate dehydratase domain-containing protein [Gemmatimonadaceae bacterium]
MSDGVWPRVAFQGERGAYSEDAIRHLWGREVSPMPTWNFGDVIQAVSDGKTEYGILPVHNTVVGAIQNAVDALAAAPHLLVTDETTIEIHHALLAPTGATLDTLTTIMSHPVALAQCGRFLSQHPHWTVRESYDTAGAARDVAAQGTRDQAAIASVRAAQRYQLAVLAEDIQDVPDNQTRFVVIRDTRRNR